MGQRPFEAERFTAGEGKFLFASDGGSKSVDARTSAAAIELKVLIDQVREQVQNIE